MTNSKKYFPTHPPIAAIAGSNTPCRDAACPVSTVPTHPLQPGPNPYPIRPQYGISYIVFILFAYCLHIVLITTI